VFGVGELIDARFVAFDEAAIAARDAPTALALAGAIGRCRAMNSAGTAVIGVTLDDRTAPGADGFALGAGNPARVVELGGPDADSLLGIADVAVDAAPLAVARHAFERVGEVARAAET
jgi:hypothetical protein